MAKAVVDVTINSRFPDGSIVDYATQWEPLFNVDNNQFYFDLASDRDDVLEKLLNEPAKTFLSVDLRLSALSSSALPIASKNGVIICDILSGESATESKSFAVSTEQRNQLVKIGQNFGSIYGDSIANLQSVNTRTDFVSGDNVIGKIDSNCARLEIKIAGDITVKATANNTLIFFNGECSTWSQKGDENVVVKTSFNQTFRYNAGLASNRISFSILEDQFPIDKTSFVDIDTAFQKSGYLTMVKTI